MNITHFIPDVSKFIHDLLVLLTFVLKKKLLRFVELSYFAKEF